MKPLTIFPNSRRPSHPPAEPGTFEVGVLFESSEDGWLLGVRLYRGATENTGPRYGRLWTADGVDIAGATAQFDDGERLGWTAAYFAVPPRIIGGERYVAGANIPQGYLSYVAKGLAKPVTCECLTAIEGRFTRQHAAFPDETHLEGNDYMVDVLFTTEPRLARAPFYFTGGVYPPADDGMTNNHYQLADAKYTVPSGWELAITSATFASKRPGGGERSSYMYVSFGLITVPDHVGHVPLPSPIVFPAGHDLTLGFHNNSPSPQNMNGWVVGYLCPTGTALW